eukprot:5495274-Amphidinium_carterae.1
MRFLLCGAVAYAALQSAQKVQPSRSCKRSAVAVPCAQASVKTAKLSCQGHQKSGHQKRSTLQLRDTIIVRVGLAVDMLGGPDASRYCRPQPRLERLTVPTKAPVPQVAGMEVKDCPETRFFSGTSLALLVHRVTCERGGVMEKGIFLEVLHCRSVLM